MENDIFEKVYELGIEKGFLDKSLLYKENFEDIIKSLSKEELESILIEIYEGFVY